MLQAVDRARAVTEAAFADSEAVEAVIRTWGRRRTGPRSPTFQRLANMGFRPKPVYADRYRQTDDETGEPYTHFFRAGPTQMSDRATLIWDACAREIGIEPASPLISVDGVGQFSSLMVDFGRGLLVKISDDRGMDVVATDRGRLKPLHAQFGSWLLDGDRARMDAMFAA
jgi:hypothetical protein